MPYTFSTRFENARGTNPEELIAAAHASCFSMALAGDLAKMGFEAREIRTTASVGLEKTDGAWSVTSSHLSVRAQVPGIDGTKFLQAAEGAKANCPISRLLNSPISMDAVLESSSSQGRQGGAA
jgi:osmotically inducible protein OsmC